MIQEPSLRDLSPRGRILSMWPQLVDDLRGPEDIDCVAAYLDSHSKAKLYRAVSAGLTAQRDGLVTFINAFRAEIVPGDAVAPDHTGGYRNEATDIPGIVVAELK